MLEQKHTAGSSTTTQWLLTPFSEDAEYWDISNT